MIRRRAIRAAAAASLAIAATAPALPVARFEWFDYRGVDPVAAAPALKPGEYRNPILAGFYPDPSITRVGEDYYVVNSTFAYFPGLPVFHSRNLVDWKQIGNALDRPGQVDFGTLGVSRGIFAPDISWHAGRFYIAGTCVDCGGNFVLTATDPAGPWSDPHWNTVDGIDSSLFFDHDGSAWMLNNGPPPETPRYSGHRAIWLQRLDLATLQPVGARTVLVDGGVHPAENPIWAEGPHLLRKAGWYYLITAEGGTAEDHREVVYRSRRITGPFVPGPGNPILTQRGLDPARSDPVTSAGHADFVRTPSGHWWATFLAVRPYQGDYYNIGRETFLLPVHWRGGWPQITAPGEIIEPVHTRPRLPRQSAQTEPTSGSFALRDEFDGPTLAPYWLRIRTPHDRWFAFADGALALTARAVPLGGTGQPSYIGRRLQHRDAVIETSLNFTPLAPGDRAGLAIVQDPAHFCALSLARSSAGTVVQLERRNGDQDPVDGTVIGARPVTGSSVRLRIVARGASYDFFYSVADGEWQLLVHDLDGTMLSTKVAGGFTGATVGPFARAGAD